MSDALVVLGVIGALVAAVTLTLRWLGTWLFPLDDQADRCACHLYRMDEDIIAIRCRGIRHTHDRCAPEDEQGQGTR